MSAFARWLVRHPIVCVLANLAATIGFGVYAIRIQVQSTIESVLPAGDPEVGYYAKVRETFGSDDVAVIGVQAQDLFAPATLEKIARITDAVAAIKGVEHVVSLTNVVDPTADVFDPPKLLPSIPLRPAAIDALKQKLRSTPLFGKNLVADDFTGTAINVFFENLTDAQYRDLRIDEQIREILDREKGTFAYTGASHIKEAAVGMMRRDLIRFTPVALALVILVLWLSFWTVRGVVLPLLSVVFALVWTLGVMVLTGTSIGLGTFILPPLLVVIGSSYGIHVMARYYEQVGAGVPTDQVVVRAFERVWLPLVVSATTMIVGFGSLTLNRIPAIRELGEYSVVGLVWLTVTSLTFIPAMLQLLGPELRSRRSGSVGPLLGRFLTWLGEWDFTRRRLILWGAIILALVSLTGIRLIRVDSDFLYYFRPDSQVRRDNETINREIVGSNPFYLVIDTDEAGAIKRWDVLKLIHDLQKFLITLPDVTASVSIVDYMQLLETGLNKGGEGDIVVDAQGHIVEGGARTSFVDDPAALKPVLTMITASPASFKSVVTPDFTRANILVRTRLSGAHRIEETLAKIRAYVATHFPADVRVHPTGNLVLLSGTTSDIVTGQIKSLSLALGAIFAIMSLMFLSLKVGFLAILPNALPIILFFGVMGWLGILLNLGTSLIADIALGIAVDSAVHYMARLNLELRGETDQRAGMVRALGRVGPPIIFTTVALFFGFLTFAFSSFVPIQNFGVLAGFTMAVALVANLVLLPALLATTKIITVWDLVGVKLGDQPTRTIPLFAGLRPNQARIVVLMGELRRFAAGDVIVRRGDRGEEMFLLLDGTVRVWGDSNHDRPPIAEHSRGAVFGEMALVRRVERSADVVAAGPVEVLAVNERFLQRLQSRYPRIASKVFLNLTRILSDRLQFMTDQFIARIA
jgi:predicted RND superfamily exporter protein